MSKRIVTLDGRLVFHMLPRSARAREAMELWRAKLAPCLAVMPAWLTRQTNPDVLLQSIAASMAFTASVEVLDDTEPALLAFKAWFDDTEPAVLMDWVIAFTELPEPIEIAWGEAFSAGLDAGKIELKRKPPELLTADEIEAATDPNLIPSKPAGNGSSNKSKPPKEKSPAVITNP